MRVLNDYNHLQVLIMLKSVSAMINLTLTLEPHHLITKQTSTKLGVMCQQERQHGAYWDIISHLFALLLPVYQSIQRTLSGTASIIARMLTSSPI
jgi:hypothetical protein